MTSDYMKDQELQDVPTQRDWRKKNSDDRGLSSKDCVLRRWESKTVKPSVFESFTVANLPYRPCG